MHLAALHTPSQIQLNQDGHLKHFLTIEGLSKETLTKILDTAQSFFNDQNQLITNNLLEGRTVMNLFFENSTRTRTTFEAAAKRLSANVLNILRRVRHILLPKPFVRMLQLSMQVMAVMRIQHKLCWTC